MQLLLKIDQSYSFNSVLFFHIPLTMLPSVPMNDPVPVTLSHTN